MSSVKKILCLANSRKHGAYCFAGIDMSSGEWIRPVSGLDDGRVERDAMLIDGAMPRLGEIIGVPLAESGPDFGFECENRSILPGPWLRHGSRSPKEIAAFCVDEPYLLHNSDAYVTVQYLAGLPFERRRTLQLTEAFDFEAFNTGLSGQGGRKWNATFVIHSGERLTARVTDPVLVEKLEQGYRPSGHCLVTVSLSMPFVRNGWDGDGDPCWKLVAGVIEMEPGTEPAVKTPAPKLTEGIFAPPRPDINDAAVSATLKNLFGFERFKANQAGLVRAILDGRDSIAIMPTGGGKSLCYQLPARLLKGTCMVISPLIALMKDQVDAAQAIGLKAASLTSGQSEPERVAVFRSLLVGDIELLYVSPERLAMETFYNNCKRLPLSLIAVDEAHCISEWGHDFRPDYLGLSSLTNRFPKVPIAAFTATATHRVERDIVERLGLRDPYVVRASFDRPNLFYEVLPKTDVESQIIEFIKSRPGEAGIVYRTSRRNVDATVEQLIAEGIRARPYHAGMDDNARGKNQEAFNRDEIDVVVATIAFGMGIDKPNVRFVVHGDLPKNMEAYYQETGRAGRDGEPSRCVLYFGYGDIPRLRHFIDQVQDDGERCRLIASLNEMVSYAKNSGVCRRRRILGYFGEEYHSPHCAACDVCTGPKERIDATIDAQIVLSAIVRTGQRFGAGHIVDVVRGANKKRVRELGHDQLPTFGRGKHLDATAWHGLIDELIGHDFIRRCEGEYPTLQLTNEAKAVLTGAMRVVVRPTIEPAPRFAPMPEKEADPALFERLRGVRRDLAQERNVPPFVIFADRTLQEMCRKLPASPEEMRHIHGIGEVKLAAYGDRFLAEIAAHTGLNVTKSCVSAAHQNRPLPAKQKSATLEQTWDLVCQGLGIADIARRRNLSELTIAEHIERLILEGRPVAIDRFVPPDVRRHVAAIVPGLRSEFLREIVDAAEMPVSFEHARLARAWIKALAATSARVEMK
jgi:ATP-dependent DNA helicase RecQ